MNEPLTVLRELVALKRLHDKIEAAEADGCSNFVDDKPVPMAKDEYAKRKPWAWAAAFALADADGVNEIHEARNPQHVLKAEGESPDATDRGSCAMQSPGGGPMGAGQAAAAAPIGVDAAPKTVDGGM